MDMKLCSSSAKVLIAGAYTILDRDIPIGKFGSFVMALKDTKFHCLWRKVDIISIASGVKYVINNGPLISFILKFPQFGAENPMLIMIDGDQMKLATHSEEAANPFVISCFKTILKVVNVNNFVEKFGGGSKFEIYLVGDAGFYANQGTEIKQIGDFSFVYFGDDVKISDVGKSGLGSSAALTTSLVKVLFEIFEGYLDERQAFWVALRAHSLGQGKLGSGFDVACAFYNSHLFYNNNICLDEDETWPILSTIDPISHGLIKLVGSEDYFPFSVSMYSNSDTSSRGGSHTPSFVKAVLKWRRESLLHEQIWQTLKCLNIEFCDILLRYCYDSNEDEDEDESQIESQIENLVRIFGEIRKILCQIGISSQVPIEPPIQSAFIQEIMEKDERSVIGGVPGSGGYDSIFVLKRLLK